MLVHTSGAIGGDSCAPSNYSRGPRESRRHRVDKRNSLCGGVNQIAKSPRPVSILLRGEGHETIEQPVVLVARLGDLLLAELETRLSERAQVIQTIARLYEVGPPIRAHIKPVQVPLLGHLGQHLDDAAHLRAETVLDLIGAEARILTRVVEKTRDRRV